MIVDVQGSHENVYQVNTDEVSCTCADYRFRCCRQPRTSEGRQCKHIREVFKEHPEYMPDDVARAMKLIDSQIEAVTNSHTVTFPKVIVETYYTLICQTLSNYEIFVIGDYFKDLQNVTGIELVLESETSPEGDLSLLDGVMSLSKTHEGDHYLDYKIDNMIPLRIWYLTGERFVLTVLFGQSDKEEINTLVTLANAKGLSLSPTGLRRADETQQAIHFENKDNLLKILKS